MRAANHHEDLNGWPCAVLLAFIVVVAALAPF
jgi:hypothetical protein